MRFIWWSFLLICHSVFATSESTLPTHCHAVAVQGETVSLNSIKKSLFFIHNLSEVDLWITHPGVESTANAGWSSQLHANKWSALFLKKGPFILHCIESKPGHEQQIPCENTVAICQWKKMGAPEHAKHTFWLAEDMSLKALIAAVGSKGFKIPVS